MLLEINTDRENPLFLEDSERGRNFRRMLTPLLREYILKGYVLNGDYLKSGSAIDFDYFTFQIEMIQEIKCSERSYVQKIADIYEQCSVDYSKKHFCTKNFYLQLFKQSMEPSRNDMLRNIANNFIDYAERMAVEQCALIMGNWIERFESLQNDCKQGRLP